EGGTRGSGVVVRCSAAVIALNAVGARRIALINPPWFSVELSEHGAGYFQSQGFQVVHNAPADLPSDQRAIHPGQLYEWVRTYVPKSAEAVFIGGNGLRAVGGVPALGKDLFRPVFSANQVQFFTRHSPSARP